MSSYMVQIVSKWLWNRIYLKQIVFSRVVLIKFYCTIIWPHYPWTREPANPAELQSFASRSLKDWMKKELQLRHIRYIKNHLYNRWLIISYLFLCRRHLVLSFLFRFWSITFECIFMASIARHHVYISKCHSLEFF